MVSTAPAKTTKHTYAERVLKAYSQAQKGRRRQSVHLATLRAHVRKIAQEKQDKLGPKWMYWVGKAVRKFEEQGIFQPDSDGYVRMTDEGKKALTVARRRVLGTSSRYTQTPGEEEQVWRALSEQFSPVSHISGSRRYSSAQSSRKRRQSMRSRPSIGVRNGELESENESEGPSTSARTSPAKRRRITNVDPFASATPSKPLSKMTKAELTKKVKELQSKLLASQTGTPHSEPRQSIAEKQRLTKDLIEAHRELDIYRRRTAIFGDQDEELTDAEDEEVRVERWLSPVGDTHITPPTPTPVRGKSNVLALPRTESGSLIHSVSKQPTPAPSDTDNWELGQQEMEYAVDNDMGAREVLLANNRDHRRVTIEGRQVITPDMTPSHQEEPEEDRDASVLRETLSSLGRLVMEKDQEIEKLRSDLAHKDRALASLVEKDNRISELQTTITSKDVELADLHGSLETKDRKISELQNAVDTACATVAERDGLLAQRDGELSAARATLADREGTLDAQVELQEGVINTLQSELQRMRAEEEDLEAKVTSAHNELHTIQEAIDRIQIDYADAKGMVVDLETELNSTRGRLQEIEERNRRNEELLCATKQQLLDMDSTNQMKDESLAEKDREIADKDTAISELERMIESITFELNHARASVDELRSHLSSIETERADSEAELRSVIKEVQSEKDALTISASDLHAEKASLEVMGQDLRQQVDALTHDLRGARSEYASAKETILGLLGIVDEAKSARDDEMRQTAMVKQALNIADAEVARLRDQVHGVEMEIQQVRGELAVSQVALVTEQTTASMLRSDLTAARGDFSMLQSELETARKDLLNARADVKRTEGEMEGIKVAKRADENTIMDLKVLYEKIKKMQGEMMSEMDKKLASMQSTSMPPQRERVVHTVAIAST
ncbi:hypothetical protein J3A83DRAFT_4211031 [Scleroderma citrinum]